MHGQQNIKI